MRAGAYSDIVFLLSRSSRRVKRPGHPDSLPLSTRSRPRQDYVRTSSIRSREAGYIQALQPTRVAKAFCAHFAATRFSPTYPRDLKFFTQAVSFLWPSTSPQPPDPVEGEESEEDEDALMPPVDRPPSLPPPTTPVQLGPTFSRPPPPGSASSTQGIYAPLTPETHTMQDDVLEHIETLSDLRLYVQARPHLNPLEKEGVVAIMARLEIKEQQQQNQFRFASVSRDASPARQSPSSSSPASSLGGLSKNPNGILRYGGVGSSRVRNKYRGAGFASASPRRFVSLLFFLNTSY